MLYLIRQVLLLYECTPYDYLQHKLLIKGTKCKLEHVTAIDTLRRRRTHHVLHQAMPVIYK